MTAIADLDYGTPLPDSTRMVALTIDGVPVSVPEGTSVMRAAALVHPHYGWERNMGYGTAQHLAALRLHGPSALHRRSFAPVSQLALPV